MHNAEYRAVLTNLLGVDMSGVHPDQQLLNDRLLHDINMGFETPRSISPHQSIKYHKVETGYLHPWSYTNVGEQFGMNRLDEFIPLRDYLELPMNCVDTIVSGVIAGKTKRAKMEEDARKAREAAAKQAGHQQPGNPTPEALLHDVAQALGNGG